MPDIQRLPRVSTGGEEGQSLLRNEHRISAPQEVVRPQVKYGRLVAGEAFELGDEDED